MANVMSLKQIDNNTSRSGFDLSTKVAYTSKIGEVLPIYCSEVLPGDKFIIKPQAFTRTQPLNTSAFTRLREYYDFYFVPNHQLWFSFKEFITQLTGESSHADTPISRTPIGDIHPYFTTYQICTYLNALDASTTSKTNLFGYNRSDTTAKLLEYLGYGVFKKFDNIWTPPGSTGSNQIHWPLSITLNPFPLLAYQKIYNDHIRNKQWETNQPWTYNVDYLSTSSMEIPMSTISSAAGINNTTMFDLRYSNWNQDFFMGLKPNAQYGSAAALNLPATTMSQLSLTSSTGATGTLATTANGQLSNSNNVVWNIPNTSVANLRQALGLSSTNSSGDVSSVFSILALRQAEAMQRWKEVTQSNDYDYASQINAHFGINVSKAHSNMSRFIGGITSNLDISEVVNTNLAEETSKADIAGKGVGASAGHISFESEEHGFIICLYTCKPILDYQLDSPIMPMFKSKVTDYAIPELDKTGMVAIPSLYLNPYTNQNTLLGYAPRYIDYKTNYDRVIGEFKSSLRNWVAPIDSTYIYGNLSSSALSWKFFKINPGIVNSLFAVDADSTTATDQLLNNCYFDVKAIRRLDYDGLPY